MLDIKIAAFVAIGLSCFTVLTCFFYVPKLFAEMDEVWMQIDKEAAEFKVNLFSMKKLNISKNFHFEKKFSLKIKFLQYLARLYRNYSFNILQHV